MASLLVSHGDFSVHFSIRCYPLKVLHCCFSYLAIKIMISHGRDLLSYRVIHTGGHTEIQAPRLQRYHVKHLLQQKHLTIFMFTLRLFFLLQIKCNFIQELSRKDVTHSIKFYEKYSLNNLSPGFVNMAHSIIFCIFFNPFQEEYLSIENGLQLCSTLS